MSYHEVPEPILNSPFEEPVWHWNIEEAADPEKRAGWLLSRGGIDGQRDRWLAGETGLYGGARCGI